METEVPMKSFEQLHLDEQNHLLIKILETLGESQCSSIEELAQQRGSSLRNVWRDICADT
jgi:predicted transcriptional regulator